MNPKYEKVHEIIMMILHNLVFGQYALMGDAKEILIRSWYKEFAEGVENEIEESIKLPPPNG